MKRILFAIITIFLCFQGYAEMRIPRWLKPVPGVDFLFFNSEDGEVTNVLGMRVIYPKEGYCKSQNIVYHNGLLIYKAKTSKGKKFGAVDLFGETVVPFNYNKINEVVNSREAQAYRPTDRQNQFINELKQTASIKKVMEKLDEYRATRLSIGDWDLSNTIYSTKEGDKGYVKDRLGNYVLEGTGGFFKNSYRDGLSSDDITSEWNYTRLLVWNDKEGLYYNLAGNGKDYWPKDVIRIPSLHDFVVNYVNLNLSKWYEKDEFETIDEYQARNTPEMCRGAQEYFADCAAAMYIQLYGGEFSLGAYDRDGGSFLLTSKVGNVPVKVDFNDSFEMRKRWENSKDIEVVYCHFSSKDEGITLASAALFSEKFPDKAMMWYGDNSLPYQSYTVDNLPSAPVVGVVQNPNPIQETINLRSGIDPISDVDTDIPLTYKENQETFALVIANEDYTHLTNVPYAAKDGRVFADYCTKVLGLPRSNVKQYSNASYATMLSAIDDIKRIAHAYGGDINLIVYYSGHGAPDEKTRGAHLLPVDTRGMDSRTSISLEHLYSELKDMKLNRATVFLDACFTGQTRGGNGDILAMGERAFLEVEPRMEVIPDKVPIVVFSASGKQSAIPDDEKGHGLFTYFLLKKLKESRGNVSYGELWDYLGENISRRSAVIGKNKVQRPGLEMSDEIRDTWSKMDFFD
ncbi:MAG: caspase family protein [Muribaculaceae bacterium]|nr:caspase family protein [Muribaculaceae bacterium]